MAIKGVIKTEHERQVAVGSYSEVFSAKKPIANEQAPTLEKNGEIVK